MTWRQRYRRASFRGIPFHVEDHEFEVGRRGVSHEFPQGEDPLFEELGRAADRIRLTGYVLGADYTPTRDKLIAACREFKGPGTLVHPYLGSMQVVCLTLRVRESVAEGGIARLDFVFAEVGDKIIPAEEIQGEPEADAAAAAVGEAAAAAAEEGIVVEGPEVVREATAGAIDELVQQLSAGQALFTGAAADVAQQAAKIAALASQAAALATAPALLVVSIKESIDLILVSAGNALSSLHVYETLLDLDGGVKGLPGLAPASLLAKVNAGKVASLARQLALGGAVRSAARVPWASLEDAQAVRDRLSLRIDDELESADDGPFRALQALRATLALVVPPPDQVLPRLRTIVLSAEEPCLVTGWRLYADPERGEEIATRNGVPFPGFLPAGVPLQVLTS